MGMWLLVLLPDCHRHENSKFLQLWVTYRPTQVDALWVVVLHAGHASHNVEHSAAGTDANLQQRLASHVVAL